MKAAQIAMMMLGLGAGQSSTEAIIPKGRDRINFKSPEALRILKEEYDLIQSKRSNLSTSKRVKIESAYKKYFGANIQLTALERAVYLICDPTLNEYVERGEPDAIAQMESLMDTIEMETSIMVSDTLCKTELLEQIESKLASMIDSGTMPKIDGSWH